eukprot:3969884-Pyramimonas_sp.AAC.1
MLGALWNHLGPSVVILEAISPCLAVQKRGWGRVSQPCGRRTVGGVDPIVQGLDVLNAALLS